MDLDRCRQALHVLSHRGPDQWGEWRDESVYLGHRRLSILDLSENGRQPMVGEDGMVAVTANGEIYNFQDLRKQLDALGHRFKSESDSEVLVHGYEQWGINGLLARVEGMYGFAVYDARQRTVFLARDRVGIKPLFYSLIDSGLTWASELKAIVALHGEQLTVDGSALYDFLTYLYVPTPKTVYRNVFKLPPAHYLEFEVPTGRCEIRQYWRLDVTSEALSVDDACEHLRFLIARSVKQQSISDVPIGFFLSGGIDSSTVVAAASQHVRIHTYTIGFRHASDNETPFARLVSDRFATTHEERILDTESMVDKLGEFRRWYDEPFGDTSAFPTYWVSRFAKESSTVVLTGDGGDELAGGYPRYRSCKAYPLPLRRSVSLVRPLLLAVRHNLPGRMPGRIANRMVRFGCDQLELFVLLTHGMLRLEKGRYRRRWGIPDDYDDYWYFRQFWREDLPLATRLQYLDFHTYLHDDILTKVDRASMAVALECRVPLLATDVVSFFFSLPTAVLYLGGELKGLLKYAYRGILPETVLAKGKKGFNIPALWCQEVGADSLPTVQERLLGLFGYL